MGSVNPEVFLLRKLCEGVAGFLGERETSPDSSSRSPARRDVSSPLSHTPACVFCACVCVDSLPQGEERLYHPLDPSKTSLWLSLHGDIHRPLADISPVSARAKQLEVGLGHALNQLPSFLFVCLFLARQECACVREWVTKTK